MNKLKSYCLFVALLLFYHCSLVYGQHNSDRIYDVMTNSWYHVNNHTSSNSSMFTWQYIQSPVSSQITDITFADSLNGFACHTAMGVIKTTDSGFNWTIISFNDTNFTTLFNGVCFINSNTGWSVGGAIQIRKTTNGGLNWVRQIPPPVAGIAHTVYFFDANTGIVAGSQGFPYQPFICKSTNGGNNWTQITPSVSGAQELRDQYWFNSNTGYICGYDVLLYTTNGGTSFTNRYSNIPPSGNGHISLLAVYFVNDMTGWIGAANLERHNIYKTINGGLNWSFQDNPISQGGMNQINDVFFINPDTGWAVHGTPASGAIMFTTNGGTNWTIEEQSVNWFDCLTAFQNSKVWCGASSGRVWYSIRSSAVGISGSNNGIPENYNLFQNYPNPFNPATHITFRIVKTGFVRLIIYDISGKEIENPVRQVLKPGEYTVDFDGKNYPSGVYLYRLVADIPDKSGAVYSDAKKMLLIK